MLRRLLSVPLLLLLAACQIPPVSPDFDPGRDFAAYRSWSWKEPGVQYQPDDPRLRSDLTEQRLRSILAEQLDQRGLRAAPSGTSGDLQAQVWLVVEERQQQIDRRSNWGGPWGPYWGAPLYGDLYTVHYKVATLQVDLIDSRDAKLVWRGSDERVLPSVQGPPEQRAAFIREGLARILSQFPPH
jgi:hypothetical protein